MNKLFFYLISFVLIGCGHIGSQTGRKGLLQMGLGSGKRAVYAPIAKSRISWSRFLKVKKQIRNWNWPLKKIRISSQFGRRKRRFHEGVDLRAGVGTPVYASSRGLVYYSGSGISGYGRMTILKHRNGLYTIYAHNRKNLYRKGKKIEKGQLIAYSGQSGRVSGPHLHFEIRQGTLPLNPVKLLPSKI